MAGSWSGMFMVAAAFLLGILCTAGGQEPQKFYLSVMVVDRNQSHFLQEFVRHYIEEGVDHVYIYDSLNSSHIQRDLHCINSTYYTIVKPWPGPRTFSRTRQTLYELIRPKTEWVIQVDVDDFISSRATPEKTVREILQFGMHSMCPIIAVPALNYAWGTMKATPEGKIRSSLIYRWAYGAEYNQTNATSWAGDRGGSTSTVGYAKNRVVFSTALVDSVRANTAVTAQKESVCVPTTRERLSCAQLLFDRAETAPKAGANHSLAGSGSGSDSGSGNETQHTELEVEVPAVDLPKYCPRHSLYRTRRSASSVVLLEEDIPGLSLVCHHYRYPSWEEWRRQYQERDAARANRMDVRDDYMLRRAAARRDHPQQREAERAMAGCHRAVGTTGARTSTGATGATGGIGSGRAGRRSDEAVGEVTVGVQTTSPTTPSTSTEPLAGTAGGSTVTVHSPVPGGQEQQPRAPAPSQPHLVQGGGGRDGGGTVAAALRSLREALQRLLGWGWDR